MSEAADGQGLEPDAAGTGEFGEEDAVAAKDHVFEAADEGDLEADAGMEGPNMAGVYAEHFAGLEVFDDDFAGELEPCRAYSADALEEEAVAAEDASTERLLKADAELDLLRGA